MQAHTWILVADGARARIFETDPLDTQQLTEIQDFVNPAAKGHDAALEMDQLGRFSSGGHHSPSNTGESKESPVEHATRMFSNQVSDFLDRACAEHRYKKLVLVASPKFLGAIRQSINKQTRQLVDKEISKDISWLNEHDITAYVNHAMTLH
ncbi:host attachment protein [Lacisediminimonas sp.]|uniref:host attachment protein n=1 Tax=Lacisediminimonas sp. TaxID=3060582 RepID=UPI00271C7F58|nr:host attachment protein [Lacisediminimonas sp.]MDO8299907.1 host attachment protein [Lacisediminimonas sp.]